VPHATWLTTISTCNLLGSTVNFFSVVPIALPHVNTLQPASLTGDSFYGLGNVSVSPSNRLNLLTWESLMWGMRLTDLFDSWLLFLLLGILND
jgi:hypothetical protein